MISSFTSLSTHIHSPISNNNSKDIHFEFPKCWFALLSNNILKKNKFIHGYNTVFTYLSPNMSLHHEETLWCESDLETINDSVNWKNEESWLVLEWFLSQIFLLLTNLIKAIYFSTSCWPTSHSVFTGCQRNRLRRKVFPRHLPSWHPHKIVIEIIQVL